MSVLEIPVRLPVGTLSVSSVNRYLRCPMSWKRHYIDREREPGSGPMLQGSAVGAAAGRNYAQKITTGHDLALEDVLDAYSDEFDHKAETEEIEWGEVKPANAKDEGASVLTIYHQTVAPTIVPVSVEREFALTPPGAEWAFRGFIDVETEDDRIVDLKVKGKALSQVEADGDNQPASYLLARREEARAGFGRPAAGFDYHILKKLKKPTVDIVPTGRTDAQLDAFYQRLLGVAREIAWRAENDEWGGAVPGTWWCSKRFCGFWDTCHMGGAR